MPKVSQNARNPESDSFAYIETLLESLAVLGKLGTALDLVTQRLPSEIFALVETTLDEASERAEYGRRGTIMLSTGSKTEGPWLSVNGGNSGHGVGASSIGSIVAPQGGLLGASSLRLAALESSTKHADHETLKDFFWTVYSKLDAVSQGLRVVYEASNRIGSVCTLSRLPLTQRGSLKVSVASRFQGFIGCKTWLAVSSSGGLDSSSSRGKSQSILHWPSLIAFNTGSNPTL